MEILNVVHRDDQLMIVERKNDRVVVSLRPAEYSFFLRSSDVTDKLTRAIQADNRVIGMEREGKWTRVCVTNGFHRKDICKVLERNKYPTFEGDVAPRRRFLTDFDPPRARPRPVFLDIETDSRVPFSRKESARVLCWALVWPGGKRRVGVLQRDDDLAERELLVRLWNELDAADQVLAWNGERFDFPVIRARSATHRIDVEMDRWLWLDQLTLFKRMNLNVAESGAEKQSFKLQDIAMAVLGEGKDNFDASKTWEAWAAGGERRTEMVRYCVKDTDLLRLLEEKTGYVEILFNLSNVCNTFPDDRGMLPLFQVEGLLMRLSKHRDMKHRSKLARAPDAPFPGAYVKDPGPSQGILRQVHVADFSSMYPSIIASWNMSPETVVNPGDPYDGPVCVAPTTNVRFRIDEKGLLPTAVIELLKLRKEWNDKKAAAPFGSPEWREADGRATAYKVAPNSFYGVVANAQSVFHSVKVAGSVTGTGQWMLKSIDAEAKRILGKEFLYGDTDSGFSAPGTNREEWKAFVDYCNTELFPRLLKEQGCPENFVKLAYEKEYEYLVMCGAKRYFGRVAHYKGTPTSDDTPPEIKGLEYKRGDTLRLTRELQAEVIDKLMGGGLVGDKKRRATCDHDPTTYEEILQRWQRRVLQDELTIDDIKQSKTIRRALDEYKDKWKKDGSKGRHPPHVELGKEMLRRGQEVGDGTKVSYYVADAKAADGCLYRLVEDWDGHCDRFELWERFIAPATIRVLEAAFPDRDWKVWHKVRPKKPRASKKRAKQADLPVAQLERAPVRRVRVRRVATN